MQNIIEKQKAEKRAAEQKEAAIWAYRVMRIPERYRFAKVNVDAPSLEKVKKVICINKWRDAKNVYIYGAVGVGKTYVLSALLFKLYVDKQLKGEELEEKRIEFIAESQLFSEILGTEEIYSKFNIEPTINKGLKRFYERYIDLLAIDDLGASHVDVEKGDVKTEILNRVVNTRYDKRTYPIFVTTNHKPEDLARIYGDRLVSRLLENCLVIKINGKDRRTNPNQEPIEKLIEVK